MIIMHAVSKEDSKILKCGVCRANISDLSAGYQSEFLFIPICKKCRNKFSKDDIELILNLMIAYGGYFGKESSEKFSLKKYILNVISEKENMDSNEINMKLMHTALLHGISPKEYIKKLEEIVKLH